MEGEKVYNKHNEWHISYPTSKVNIDITDINGKKHGILLCFKLTVHTSLPEQYIM
jgi:hypothetical protein